MRPPPTRLLAGLVLIAIVVLTSRPAAQLGLGCSIGATPVAFGGYSSLNASPTDGAGTVTVQCAVGLLVRVSLSRGTAPSFAPRTLTSGAHALPYNLFTTSGRTQVWGDGTGATITQSILLVALGQHVWQVYGRIPAGQDVPLGNYSDTVTAAFIF